MHLVGEKDLPPVTRMMEEATSKGGRMASKEAMVTVVSSGAVEQVRCLKSRRFGVMIDGLVYEGAT